ncbi:MAG: hypothetical protein Q8L48_23820 [Archangium sp.]|nr:hypothetical protein [Archangium sp.]
MIFAALAAAWVAAVPTDTRGTSGDLPRAAAPLRHDLRVRAGVGAGVVFALSNDQPSGGIGLNAELGFTIDDRVALLLHLEVGTAVLTVIGSGGVVAEVALGEHFGVGWGVAASGWRPSGSLPGGFYGLTFPLRLHFSPQARGAHDRARRGLLIGLQVSPGVSLQPASFYEGRPPAPAAFTAALSFTYAVW